MTKDSSWEFQPREVLQIPVISRIALILSHRPALSKLFLIFMFIIYQIEIFTIVQKPTACSIKVDPEASSQIFNNVYNTVYFEDFDPASRSSDNILSILVIMGIYLLLDISLVMYMVVALYKRKQAQQTIENICNALGYIHQLLLFCPIHIFCCKVLYMLHKGEELALQTEALVILAKVLCWLIIMVNSVWSLVKILLFTINIKTKDPLSSKTNLITLLDFIFRVTLPLLEAFVLQDGTFIYGLLVANLVYSVLRDCLLFYFLPYFKLPTLKVAVISHAVITSFAFADLISRPISQSRSYPELKFLFPIWILCIIVTGKLYSRYFNLLIRDILQKPTNVSNPYHLIHYFRIVRFYSKTSQPRAHTDKVKENYLIYTSVIKQLPASHLLVEEENVKLDHKTQAIIDQHFIKYNIDLLKTAIKKNPKVPILRIKLAHYYAKYENLYVLANQTLDDSIGASFGIKNSYFFIKIFVLNQLRNLNQDQNDNNGGNLDRHMLQKYIYMQERYKELKRNINDQLKRGIQFWKQFQSPGSDYLSLANLGDQAAKRADRIKRSIITDYKAFQEVNFAEAFLAYSLFCFLGDNDGISAQKWFTEYSQLKLKIVRSLKTLSFNSQSLYFVLSASQDQFGTILDCSGQVDKLFRIRKEMLIKQQQLSIIMPQVYGKWFEDLLRGLCTNSNLEILDRILEIPLVMKDGYVMSHYLYFTLNYINEFGLCFSILLSPLSKSNSKRTVLIMENGQILNISKEFSEDLMDMDIKHVRDRKAISIYHLCPSLEEIIKDLANKTTGDLQQKSTDPQSETNIKGHLSIFADNEGAPEKNISPQNYVKKVDLVFSSFSNEISPNAKKFIEYTAEIRMRLTQSGHFFELRMTKINDKKDTMLITKSSRKPSIYMFNPLRTGLTEHNTEPESPAKTSITSPTLQKRRSSHKTKVTGERLTSKNNLLYLDTASENATNQMTLTLMSPLSEGKKLMSYPKGDTHNDLDFISEESPKGFDSMSFDKEKEKYENQPTLDFMSISDAETSAISIGLKRIDAYKQIRRAIESKTYRRSKYVYILCFIVTLIVQMTFLIWLNIYTSNVSENVGSLSQVIQSSYFRSYWTKIATSDITILAAIRGDWYDFDYDTMIEGLTQDLESINQYNQDLMTYLSFLDDEIQAQFYQKEVRIKERDEHDNLQLVSIDDTFGATSKIISYGLNSMNETQRVFTGPDILDTNTKFFVDNSFNDLMAVSENLTLFVEAKLFSTFTAAKSTMKGALYTGIAVLVLFILVSFKFVSSLNKDSGRFVEIISTFELDEIAQTGNYLSSFMELLENDANDTEMLGNFSRANSSLQRKTTHMKNINRDANKRNKISHTASMKKFNRRNYLMLIGLFICLGLMAGFTMIYYHLASDKILTMERQHTSLNSALNFLNIVCYITPSLEIVSVLNATSTSTIENIPVLDFLAETANKLENISELQDTLKDSNGDTPEYQQEILFKFNCTEVYSPNFSFSLEDLEAECFPIANGLDTVGLLDIIIQLGLEITQFTWNFENEARDITGLQARNAEAYDVSYYTDIGTVLLLLSYSYSVGTFANLILELENERVTLAWIAVTVSIILGVITWMFIVRKLARKEFQQKRMLALIPARLVIGNYLLMKYINELV